MPLLRIRFFRTPPFKHAPQLGKKLFLGALLLPHLLQAQILAPTPPPHAGPTPPGVPLSLPLPAQTAYPGANVPSVPTPPGIPSPFPTPNRSVFPSSGSLPPSLPPPQPPPTTSASSSAPVPLPSPYTTVVPSGSLPGSLPQPSAMLTPSGASSESGAFAPSSSPTPSEPPSQIPALIEPTPFPSVPLNTPPPGTSILGTGTLSSPSSNFPSALLPPVPTPAEPTASVPRVRVAQSAELGVNAPKLTLDGAVQYALSHNPDILNAVQQIRLTRGQVISVQAQLLPSLVVTSAFNEQSPILANPPSPGRGRFTIPVGVDNTGNLVTQEFISSGTINNISWGVSIGIQQLLFDGGGALASRQAARYLEDQAYFTLRSVIDNLIAEVKIAFYQIILNRALIIVQEQSVALLENQLEDQESRYQAGTVPKFNVLQAQVALANAVPPLITARNNLRISQYQLVQILGMNYTGDATQVPFHVVGTLDVHFRTIFPEESIRVGLTRNPSLKAQRENILSQAAQITASLSGYYPRITFGGGYLAQNNVAFQNLGNTVEGWFFGFTGTWNIFDGGNTYGQVAQTKAALAQAKISYDNSVRTVILNIQQDISNLQQAQETIESQRASVVQATEALRLARERLDAGAGTQLDVLNAQVALLQAQTTVLQAQYNYIKALAQYDAALSLNTQYAESFRDPLENREKWRFAKLNGAGYKMPPLPRIYRNKDPVTPILAATPTPLPTPSSRRSAIRPKPTPHPHP